jgi:hypothetical protein
MLAATKGVDHDVRNKLGEDLAIAARRYSEAVVKLILKAKVSSLDCESLRAEVEQAHYLCDRLSAEYARLTWGD